MKHLGSIFLASLALIGACDSAAPREAATTAKVYAANRTSMQSDSTQARGRVFRLERGQTQPVEVSEAPPPPPADCSARDTAASPTTSGGNGAEASLTTVDPCGNRTVKK